MDGNGHRVKSIEGMRFIMMTVIILSHCEFLENTSIGYFYSRYLHNATMGVDFFFIVSGFGLYLAFMKNAAQFKKVPMFDFRGGIRRIRKLYPLYICTMLISIVPYCGSRLHDQSLQTVVVNSIVKFVPSLFLLQSLTGLTTFSIAFNGVGWFLSTLFILYLVAPFLAKSFEKFDDRYTMRILIINIIATVLAFAVFRFIDMRTPFDDLSYGSPYFRVFFIGDGMMIAKLFKEKKIHYGKSASDLFVFLALAWFPLRNTVAEYILPELIRTVDIVLCVLMICALLNAKGYVNKVFAGNTIVYLGGLTGLMFLIHYPIRQYIGMAIDNEAISITVGVICAISIFVMSICISAFYIAKMQGKARKR